MKTAALTGDSGTYGGIDRFRLIAAFLIVGIHTYPLVSVSSELNFLFIHVFARIAVPFFLMATGYFLLPRYFDHPRPDRKPLIRFLKKTGLLYAGATLLYLPISVYAGHYADGNAWLLFVRDLLFDGTFYHLWYLPAVMLGVLLVYALGRKCSLHLTIGITVALYVLGLLGDSYFGLVTNLPFLHTIYETGFHVFSYTRNGLFYAPVFLTLGAWAATRARPIALRENAIGFILSMALMLAEGALLARLGISRHTSMYVTLLPCMVFLFGLVKSRSGTRSRFLRDTSMWIYILHPLFIIGVRGMARIAGLTDILVGNSILHYLAACGLSFTCAAVIAMWGERRTSAPSQKSRAWIALNMEHLRHNVAILQGILPEQCQLMPAVKANAYGHGAIEICRELNRLGIRAFCVASVMEGVELRKRRIKGNILILGYTHPDQLHLLRRYRLMQTVVDSAYAKTLHAYGKKLTVHIAIDTGMKRLGVSSEHMEDIAKILAYENLVVDGIYSHFSAQSDAFTQTQTERFHTVLSKIKALGYAIPNAHLQGSYGVFHCPELAFDYARVGIALYGAMAHDALRPVLSLKARVSTVKTVFAGEYVGYGTGFIAPHTMKIAVLSIGYADGIPRSLSCGVGNVLIDGSRAPIVGHVCMDQTIVDVTTVENVKQGDIAVLIGKDGNMEISALDIAEQAMSVPNEILSRLGGRLERVQGGESRSPHLLFRGGRCRQTP